MNTVVLWVLWKTVLGQPCQPVAFEITVVVQVNFLLNRLGAFFTSPWY